MVEEEPGSVDNDPPAVEPQPGHDFSVVQGFQVVDAEDHRSGRAGDEAWREALKLELGARAERLRQSVDAAIVLSNDGIIRWLGDPVAKLSLGPNALNPSALIFADESLPDASRETIKTRIELWIAATTRRLWRRSSRWKAFKRDQRPFVIWLTSWCGRLGCWSANRSRRRSGRSVKTTGPS